MLVSTSNRSTTRSSRQPRLRKRVADAFLLHAEVAEADAVAADQVAVVEGEVVEMAAVDEVAVVAVEVAPGEISGSIRALLMP